MGYCVALASSTSSLYPNHAHCAARCRANEPVAFSSKDPQPAASRRDPQTPTTAQKKIKNNKNKLKLSFSLAISSQVGLTQVGLTLNLKRGIQHGACPLNKSFAEVNADHLKRKTKMAGQTQKQAPSDNTSPFLYNNAEGLE